jgi:hypothetical protein
LEVVGSEKRLDYCENDLFTTEKSLNILHSGETGSKL